jgi:gamma-glutamyl:cysteine ligase YbdK (ATP-grasp superfamily)
MPDQPTELERTVGFVALLKGLCDAVLERPPVPHDPAGRGMYQQNRWAASRFGLAAELVHPDGDRTARASELAIELAALAGEHGLDPTRMEADRQLEVGRVHGLEAVCADLVERTLG